jgi:spore germination cell wall hydrolase CwlJ-like protein
MNACEPLLLAATLFYEARGEGEVGIRAVASVIYTRAHYPNPHKPKPYIEVISKRKAFSCWNDRPIEKIDERKLSNGDRDAYYICLRVAEEMAERKFKPTIEATHYYNPKLCKPSWAREMKFVKKIRNHTFMDERAI